MLRVLLRNLLDNAIRYSPQNGQVSISFDCGARCISISDSGPGIDPADYEKVFERFYRGEVRETVCGIGLSIVKQIADMHGAEIKLARSALGGLTICVLFSESV